MDRAGPVGPRHDARVRYRLDPDLPETLAAPDRLRLGGRSARAELPDTALVRALIEEARLGTTRAGLERRARRFSSVPAAERAACIDALLAACDPVPPVAPPRLLVLVRATPASAPLGRRIARELLRRGHRALVGAADSPPRTVEGETAGLVVDVADRVLEPHRHLPLVSADLPHLAVVREPGRHLIGPAVLPGRSPCLRCDELHRVEAERAWAVVAPQLLRLAPPPADDELEWRTGLQLGALVESLLRALVAAERAPAHPLLGGRVTVEATGEVTSCAVPFHDGCGCRALPRTATPAPSSRRGAAAAPTRGAARAGRG